MARILVVDDDYEILDRCLRRLKKAGYQVHGFENPEEALEILRSGRSFDCLLVDLRMPLMDGGTFLEHATLFDPDVVAIAMTAYASVESAFDSARRGARYFLTKPFTTKELLHCVEKAVKRTQAHREAKRKRSGVERDLEVFSETRIGSKTVIHHLSDGLLVIDKNGQLLMENPTMSKILDQYLAPDTHGNFEQAILHTDLKELIRNSLTKSGAASRIQSLEITIGEKSYYARASRIPAKEGGGVVVLLYEISELKQLDKIRSRFVAMAAQELRTPLKAVEDYFNLFLDPEIPLSDEKRYIVMARIRERMSSMRKLVDSILLQGNLENDLNTGLREHYDLAGILEDAINDSIEERGERDIVLRHEYVSQTAIVMGNGDELVRLFAEVIGNAFKFNREAGEVRVVLLPGETFHEVRIIDSGIGIPAEWREKIFDEFARVRDPSTMGNKGPGLGLAIASQIVKSHEGRIELTSEYGKGSEFRIFLPAVSEK